MIPFSGSNKELLKFPEKKTGSLNCVNGIILNFPAVLKFPSADL